MKGTRHAQGPDFEKGLASMKAAAEAAAKTPPVANVTP